MSHHSMPPTVLFAVLPGCPPLPGLTVCAPRQVASARPYCQGMPALVPATAATQYGCPHGACSTQSLLCARPCCIDAERVPVGASEQWIQSPGPMHLLCKQQDGLHTYCSGADRLGRTTTACRTHAPMHPCFAPTTIWPRAGVSQTLVGYSAVQLVVSTSSFV